METYYSVFRRPDALLVQGACLALLLIIWMMLGLLPWWMAALVFIEMLYAGILLSRAQNLKQHVLYALIWAISSFIIIVLGMIGLHNIIT